MAKPSASTFVVIYSVVLLILFVTFSVLMSKVNPDRIFFEDEVSTDPPVGPDAETTGGDEVPIAPTTAKRLLHYARRSSDNVNCLSLLNFTTDNFTYHVKGNNTGDAPPKETIGKERRSLKDPSSVLDHLGIVVLEVVDEESQPRIEIMFHPKRSLIRKTKSGKASNNRKSFNAHRKAKTRKGLVTELTANSVIKIMPDNTIVLESSNSLVSEENAPANSNADVPSTVVETVLLPTETSDVIKTTLDSAISAVIDKSPRKVTGFKAGVTLEITDEKQFEDTETIETTTDDTFERPTNIDDVFESINFKSSEINNLSETIGSNAFGSNSSITTTYGYKLDTIDVSENYNNTETIDIDNFDVNDIITTEYITVLYNRSSTQITGSKQTLDDNYATEMVDNFFEASNSNNTTAEINVKNVDVNDATDFEINNTIHPLADADITQVNDTITFETTEESVTSDAKDTSAMLDSKTFDTHGRFNTPNATFEIRDIIKTATNAKIFIVETSENTDFTLQNMETTTNALESTTVNMKNSLEVISLIDNAVNAVGNTDDNPTTDWHVTTKSIPNSLKGYFATDTIFNDK